MPPAMDACNAFLEAYFEAHCMGGGVVLEAGGGSFFHFSVPGAARLLALDVSPSQLRRNAHPCAKVLGDVQAMPLQAGSVEMAVCFNVLEHVERPEAALAELARVLKPEGLLVLGAPERGSLKGVATRLTPVWLHRRYYRHVVKKGDRGEGHFDAFPTPFGRVVSARRTARAAAALDLEVLLARSYDGMREYQMLPKGLPGALFRVLYYGVGAAARAVSLGRWDPLRTDFLMVARKVRGSTAAGRTGA